MSVFFRSFTTHLLTNAMKKTILFLISSLLFGCGAQQKAVVAPESDLEFRQLDTMVVSANTYSPDDKVSYGLPTYHASRKREK